MGDLSTHFDRSELACNCGCGFDTVDHVLLAALEAIRVHFGQPVTVTSGCRCTPYNELQGGSDNSQHTKGRAADIIVRDTSPSLVAKFAEHLGLSVGRYANFTHLDTRSGTSPARWLG